MVSMQKCEECFTRAAIQTSFKSLHTNLNEKNFMFILDFIFSDNTILIDSNGDDNNAFQDEITSSIKYKLYCSEEKVNITDLELWFNQLYIHDNAIYEQSKLCLPIGEVICAGVERFGYNRYGTNAVSSEFNVEKILKHYNYIYEYKTKYCPSEIDFEIVLVCILHTMI